MDYIEALKLQNKKDALFERMVRKLVRRFPQYDNHDLVDARSDLNELIDLAIELDRINLKDS